MDDLYSILGKIKTENRRLTQTRIGILKALFEFKKPLETKQINKWLSRNRIRVDRTTVYRQLRYLASKNFLNKFQVASGKKYYELTQDHHHHLVCLRCQKIQNVAMTECPAQSAEKKLNPVNFKILGHSLEFYGLCDKCAPQEQKKAPLLKQA